MGTLFLPPLNGFLLKLDNINIKWKECQYLNGRGLGGMFTVADGSMAEGG